MVPTKGRKPSLAGDEYMTPRWVWEPWHEALGFTLDAAASDRNRLPVCPRWFTKEQDALKQDWLAAADGAAAWCNPPYSRAGGPLVRWVTKALEESQRGLVVCMLLPADTSTDWFSLLWDRDAGAWKRGVHGYFTDTRIRFVNPATGEKTKGSPCFGSLIVVLSKPYPNI